MVNVIGLGYIGLPTALMMATHGVKVVGTDYNKELVETLNHGKTTFKEDGLDELYNDAVSAGIVFTTDYQITDEFTRKHNIVKTLLLTSVIGYCLFWFRSQNIIILIALIVCIVIIGQYELSTWKRILIAAAFAAILIVLAPMTDLINSILDISKHYTSNYLSYSGNGFSQIVFSLPLLPFGFFVRMAYAIISPIPTGIIQILTVFDVDSIANFFISCGTIYQIYQLPHLVRGTKKLNDTAMCFLMVWFVVASTTFTFRHFIMMYPFMGYIIAEQKEENKKNYKFFITVGILFLGAIYVVLSL